MLLTDLFEYCDETHVIVDIGIACTWYINSSPLYVHGVNVCYMHECICNRVASDVV